MSEDVTLKEGLDLEILLRHSICNDCTWGTCVGLAAPQIGFNKNVFIALDRLYINPEVEWYSTDIKDFMEGCYSLDEGGSYKVTRPQKVRMNWINKKGKKCQQTFVGFEAEVVQHEYDHLLGKLCCGDNTPKI